MILQLFFDESGYGQTARDEAFIFAGFLGTVRTFETMDDDWRSLLRKRPTLTARGFKNLLRRKRNSPRVTEFVDVLAACENIHRVSVTIPRVAFEKAVISEIPKWRNRLDAQAVALVENEYFFGFYTIISNILLPMVASLKDRGRLEVIYDEQIQEADKVESGYEEFVKQTPEAKQFVRKPRAGSDEDFMPLQAADLLAWHMHREFIKRQHGEQHDDLVWKALTELPSYPALVLGDGDLRKIVAWDELERRLTAHAH